MKEIENNIEQNIIDAVFAGGKTTDFEPEVIEGSAKEFSANCRENELVIRTNAAQAHKVAAATYLSV
ncbi:hypothetical protein ACYULU_01870 [Breznakiellaceae bacterium SP9]